MNLKSPRRRFCLSETLAKRKTFPLFRKEETRKHLFLACPLALGSRPSVKSFLLLSSSVRRLRSKLYAPRAFFKEEGSTSPFFERKGREAAHFWPAAGISGKRLPRCQAGRCCASSQLACLAMTDPTGADMPLVKVLLLLISSLRRLRSKLYAPRAFSRKEGSTSRKEGF